MVCDRCVEGSRLFVVDGCVAARSSGIGFLGRWSEVWPEAGLWCSPDKTSSTVFCFSSSTRDLLCTLSRWSPRGTPYTRLGTLFGDGNWQDRVCGALSRTGKVPASTGHRGVRPSSGDNWPWDPWPGRTNY